MERYREKAHNARAMAESMELGNSALALQLDALVICQCRTAEAQPLTE